jgi:alpha-1,6-mannosyltransferase
MSVEVLPRRSLVPRVRRPGRELAVAGLGHLALAGLFAGTLIIVLGAASNPGPLSPANHSRLPAWIAGPLDGHWLRVGPGGFIAIMGGLVLCYAGVLACRRALAPRTLVIGVGALYLLLALGPPLLSADIFSYLAYARMGALHGVDPYTHGPWAIAHDPVFAFTHWRSTPSVYGPLFTLLSYAIAPLGLTAGLWTLKSLALAGAAAVIWLTGAATRRRGQDSWMPVLLVALNPMMLVYAAGGGHNDLLMLALAMAAVTLSLAGERASAGAAALASAAIKASSVVVLPFMVLGTAREGRGRLVGGMVAAAAGLAAISLVALGASASGFARTLAGQKDLASISSWPVTLDTWIGPGTDLRTAARLAAAAILAGLLVATWRRRLDWIAGAGWALLVIGVTSPWLLAWYTVWPLPFAAVARDRRLIAATLFAQLLFLAHRIPAVAG